MKRGGPLRRRTPLVAEPTLSRRGPLPPMSAKRRAQSLERRHFVRDFLAKNPRCQVRWDVGCTGWAIHVHEAWTRARGGPIVPDGREQQFVATCWYCHMRIHDNPAEATTRGWLRSA